MKKIKFYDTNAIIEMEEIDEVIYLSSVTLHELENIKVSKNKDEDVKFKARRATRLLRENESKYVCIIPDTPQYDLIASLGLEISNDTLICACAHYLVRDGFDVTFVTNDICCYNIAKKIFKLNCEATETSNEEEYKGFVKIVMSDAELDTFYKSKKKKNNYGILENEYMFIQDSTLNVIDIWKWTRDGFIQVENSNIYSKMFGQVKPKDVEQLCVLDSFHSNKITMVKGKAGSGKSFLSLAYLFGEMEKNRLDRIIIFCNPVETRGSARLGFLPGDKDDKLLGGAVGSFLLGKFGGDLIMIQELIQKGKLILLPMCAIRGFDTTDMKAGIYIPEAQNTDVDLMKLCLQRIGEDCICIIDGDYEAQVDMGMYEGRLNGMRRASEIFRGTSVYGEIELQTIYRSKIAAIADKM